MSNGLKSLVRDLLPKSSQVPAKYWYNRLRGTLEEEMRILRFIIQNNDLVIDVGGNRGIYAYHFWKLGARVEVFEPNPKCAALLNTWSDGKPSVHVHTAALSNCSGSANLHIPCDDSGLEHDASASIENTEFSKARDQLVTLQTLDSYRFKNVNMIKIDVEGHEFSVIEGAAATLISSRPALLVEIEQRLNGRPISEVFAKILSFGYQGYYMMSGKLLSVENFNVASHQSMESFDSSKGQYINNFLFLHEVRIANGEYGVLFGGRPLT